MFREQDPACLVITAASAKVLAQAGQPDLAELRKNESKVFLDCEDYDIDYVRTEIPFVNYVRDRKEADVHVLITTQGMGSGDVL